MREKTRSAVGREKVWDLQTHKDKGEGRVGMTWGVWRRGGGDEGW